MKVVLTHTDLRIYWPARIRELRLKLKQAGDNLHVIEIAGNGSPYSFAGPAEQEMEDWEILFPDCRMEDLSPSKASAALYNRLESINPDIVMAGAIAFPSGATAIRWSASRDKACVIFDDARKADVPRPWIHNAVKRRINRFVGSMLLPAISHASDYEAWGIPNDRMFFGVDVVDNATIHDIATAFSQSKTSSRNPHNLPERFFLGVGRQIPRKNWIGLIEAFAKYSRAAGSESWSLVLVGNGPQRAALESMVSNKKLDNVHFFDYVSQRDIPEFYARASALVLPSFDDPWGLVVNEAMACGLPVIVSRGCGCAESLVSDGSNGWTIDPSSKADIAKRLKSIASLDNAARTKMGKASEVIIADWGLDRFASSSIAAIKKAILSKRVKPSVFDMMILNLWKGRYRPS